MRLTGPLIISELRDKLRFEVGRHLYGVLGTYERLARFEREDLGQARDPEGRSFPAALNLNAALLAHIGDDDLRQMVKDEARRPQTVRYHLNRELDSLLGELLQRSHFLIVKQVELLFAHNLDWSVFRTRASNRNHVLLLLPGEKRGDQIALFQEATPRFHRVLPANLLADNHLWELDDG